MWGYSYVCYVDDLVILLESEKVFKWVKVSIMSYIEKVFCLKVNVEKSRVCCFLDLNYLGYSLFKNGMLILSY